jgi:hypothetical protein
METATLPPPVVEVRPRTLGLALIPPEKVMSLPRAMALGVIECLEKACSFSGGRFDVQTTLRACAGENPAWHAQLWLAGYSGGAEPPTVEAAAVSQRTVWPTQLVTIEMILVGGRGAKDWMHFAPKLKQWAMHQDAAWVQMVGRRGWAKTLPDDWKPVAHIYECPLVEAEDGGR